MNNSSDFIECTCPNCGANISIANNTDDAVCTHCNTRFKVRESDAVKISRIENRTRQEIEAENARLKLELQRDSNEHKRKNMIIGFCVLGSMFLLSFIMLIIMVLLGEVSL